MRRFLLFTSLFAVIVGCAKPSVEPVSDSARNGEITAEKAKPAASSIGEPSDEQTATAVDAETLFASALELASKDDKRVLVHLGAPW